MPPKIDLIAEDYQEWKQKEAVEVMPLANEAIDQIWQFAFQAGWLYCDRRNSTVGQSPKTKQQTRREKLGTENGRPDTTKLGKKMGQKRRHTKRGVSD